MYEYYSGQQYDELCPNRRADFIRLLLSATTSLDIADFKLSDELAEKYFRNRNLSKKRQRQIKSHLDRTLFRHFLESVSETSQKQCLHKLCEAEGEKEDFPTPESMEEFFWNVFCNSLGCEEEFESTISDPPAQYDEITRPKKNHSHKWSAEYTGQIWISLHPSVTNTEDEYEIKITWGIWKIELNLEMPRGVVLVSGKAPDAGEAVTMNVHCNHKAFVRFGQGELDDDAEAINIRDDWMSKF